MSFLTVSLAWLVWLFPTVFCVHKSICLGLVKHVCLRVSCCVTARLQSNVCLHTSIWDEKKNLSWLRVPQEIKNALEINVCGLKGQDRVVVWTPCGVNCPDYVCVVLILRGSFGLSKDAWTSESFAMRLKPFQHNARMTVWWENVNVQMQTLSNYLCALADTLIISVL